MWNDYALARALHVFAVVLWIGGVGLVTTVLIPALRRRIPLAEQYPLFETIEHRFAAQARLWVLLTLASGLWLLMASGGWARLSSTPWLWPMLLVWTLFFAMLFVLEPLLVHRLLRNRAVRDPAATMARLQAMHVLLLALSLLAVFAGVLGAHGGWPG